MGKKILFLATHFISLYSTRRELIQELCEQGYDVYLSLPESDDNKFFTDLGCKILPIKVDRRGTNPFKDIFVILNYFKTIRKFKPDIILSYEIKPNIYGGFVNRFLRNPKTRKKYFQVCNITGTGATFLEDDFLSKFCKFLYKISVKHTSLVYFQNPMDKEFFVKNKMVKSNFALLPGSGVNLNQFSLKELPKDDEVGFIFIARVMKLKGIDEYLEAAQKIKEKYSNVKFYIAGFNEEENYMRIIDEYDDKGIVEYLGFRSDIVNCIEKCHCTVLPSHGGEGVPNVLLESAAMGRACIGSKIAGTVDVIEDGKTGYLFTAKNSDELAAVIEKYLMLSYQEKVQMGLRGRERMENIFDRNIVIKKYIEVIEKEVN